MNHRISCLNNARGWLSLELSNCCNFQCRYCYRLRVDRMKQCFMEKELLERLFLEIKRQGYQYAGVKLNWLGESTLHPRFEAILRELMCEPWQEAVCLETNLSLPVDVFCASDLPDKPFYLTVSIDTLDRDKYAWLKGVDCLDEVLARVRELIMFRDSAGRKFPRLRLQFIIMPENFDEIGRILVWAKGIGINSVRFQEDLTACEDYVLFRRLIAPLKQREADILFCEISGENPVLIKEAGKRGPCEKLWATPFVRADGSVLFCSEDPEMSMLLGNLNQSSFTDLWMGDKISIWRRQHIEKCWELLPEKCRACGAFWDTLPEAYFSDWIREDSK
ncbi:MAG: radical SAM protein [Candidatus Wallbacteria bacterium]|nr:radical SAM protein [Candidatus Wallbacteria bacterium]